MLSKNHLSWYLFAILFETTSLLDMLRWNEGNKYAQSSFGRLLFPNRKPDKQLFTLSEKVLSTHYLNLHTVSPSAKGGFLGHPASGPEWEVHPPRPPRVQGAGAWFDCILPGVPVTRCSQVPGRL